jgi:hypothetical protein
MVMEIVPLFFSEGINYLIEVLIRDYSGVAMTINMEFLIVRGWGG